MTDNICQTMLDDVTGQLADLTSLALPIETAIRTDMVIHIAMRVLITQRYHDGNKDQDVSNGFGDVWCHNVLY